MRELLRLFRRSLRIHVIGQGARVIAVVPLLSRQSSLLLRMRADHGAARCERFIVQPGKDMNRRAPSLMEHPPRESQSRRIAVTQLCDFGHGVVLKNQAYTLHPARVVRPSDPSGCRKCGSQEERGTVPGRGSLFTHASLLHERPAGSGPKIIRPN